MPLQHLRDRLRHVPRLVLPLADRGDAAVGLGQRHDRLRLLELRGVRGGGRGAVRGVSTRSMRREVFVRATSSAHRDGDVAVELVPRDALGVQRVGDPLLAVPILRGG